MTIKTQKHIDICIETTQALTIFSSSIPWSIECKPHEIVLKTEQCPSIHASEAFPECGLHLILGGTWITWFFFFIFTCLQHHPLCNILRAGMEYIMP